MRSIEKQMSTKEEIVGQFPGGLFIDFMYIDNVVNLRNYSNPLKTVFNVGYSYLDFTRTELMHVKYEISKIATDSNVLSDIDTNEYLNYEGSSKSSCVIHKGLPVYEIEISLTNKSAYYSRKYI